MRAQIVGSVHEHLAVARNRWIDAPGMQVAIGSIEHAGARTLLLLDGFGQACARGRQIEIARVHCRDPIDERSRTRDVIPGKQRIGSSQHSCEQRLSACEHDCVVRGGGKRLLINSESARVAIVEVTSALGGRGLCKQPGKLIVAIGATSQGVFYPLQVGDRGRKIARQIQLPTRIVRTVRAHCGPGLGQRGRTHAHQSFAGRKIVGIARQHGLIEFARAASIGRCQPIRAQRSGGLLHQSGLLGCGHQPRPDRTAPVMEREPGNEKDQQNQNQQPGPALARARRLRSDTLGRMRWMGAVFVDVGQRAEGRITTLAHGRWFAVCIPPRIPAPPFDFVHPSLLTSSTPGTAFSRPSN